MTAWKLLNIFFVEVIFIALFLAVRGRNGREDASLPSLFLTNIREILFLAKLRSLMLTFRNSPILMDKSYLYIRVVSYYLIFKLNLLVNVSVYFSYFYLVEVKSKVRRCLILITVFYLRKQSVYVSKHHTTVKVELLLYVLTQVRVKKVSLW